MAPDYIQCAPRMPRIDSEDAANSPADRACPAIGLIADTHGLLRPQALNALSGSDLIIHAGDIGDGGILESLRSIAPVVAVRGNNDHGAWADDLPEVARTRVAGIEILTVHAIADLRLDPAGSAVRIVVHGHSHRPEQDERDGVLYVNPGSAGPRRFRLPVSVARLRLVASRIDVEMLPLL